LRGKDHEKNYWICSAAVLFLGGCAVATFRGETTGFSACLWKKKKPKDLVVGVVVINMN